MDFEKDDDEYRGDKKRMKLLLVQRLVDPFDQFYHQLRRVERRCRLEHDADFFALGIERADMVGVGFIAAAMPRILAAVRQQVAVQLLDVIFGRCNLIERCEDSFHHFGISRHFLFVAGGEVLNFDIGQQPLNIAVR